MTEKVYPTYSLPSGIEVKLKGISPFLLQAIMFNDRGKPKPPMHEIKIAGKRKMVPNEADEKYLKDADNWEVEKNQKIVKLLTTKSVVGDVSDYLPNTKVQEYRDLCDMIFDGEYTETDMTYIWLSDELDTIELFSDFQEAVQQLTMPTSEAVDESSKSPESTS